MFEQEAYPLSKFHQWYGLFKCNIMGKISSFPGEMTYSPEEGFFLELVLTEHKKINRNIQENPLLRLFDNETVIKGVVSSVDSSETKYVTLYCSYINPIWESDFSRNKSIGDIKIPAARLGKIRLRVLICFIHNNKYYSDVKDDIEHSSIFFNEALDDFFYPEKLPFGRDKDKILDALTIKIDDTKILEFKEIVPYKFESKSDIIKNNFYCENEKVLNELNENTNVILKDKKYNFYKIDNDLKKIYATFKYINTTKESVFGDIKILCNYFRLITKNYTLYPDRIFLKCRRIKTPFSVLYYFSDTEIKTYRKNVPDSLLFSKIFFQNNIFLSKIPMFFEKYDAIETLIFILNENNNSLRFSKLYLSRTIDCLANIATNFYNFHKKEKFQKIINKFFRDENFIIEKIDNILIKNPIEGDATLSVDEKRGLSISNIRAKIVHFNFDKNSAFPNIFEIKELNKIFELIVVLFILEKIGFDGETRKNFIKATLFP